MLCSDTIGIGYKDQRGGGKITSAIRPFRAYSYHPPPSHIRFSLQTFFAAFFISFFSAFTPDPFSLTPSRPKIAKKFTITYDLDISGRIGPRQYIRPMWLHFCAVRNCYRLSNGRVGVGDGVTVRYVVPRRTKFDQSLETFWEAEGKGQWPEERWETFKKCLATRIKSTWQIEECGCK